MRANEGECANCGPGHLGRPSKKIKVSLCKGCQPFPDLCFACGGFYEIMEPWRIKQLSKEFADEGNTGTG
jgi:hypothetical protein